MHLQLRRDFSDDGTPLLECLAERQVPALLALTKIDKLEPMCRAERVRRLKKSQEGRRWTSWRPRRSPGRGWRIFGGRSIGGRRRRLGGEAG